MKRLKIFNIEHLDKNIVLSKTEYMGVILTGSDKANNLYGTHLSNARVENKYDPSIKMIVMTKSCDKNSNIELMSSITNWFRDQKDTNLSSSKYANRLSSYIRSLQKKRKKNNRTSLGLAMCDSNGNVIIYNVGSLMHHIKYNGSNGLLDVTYLDPTGSISATFESSYGSFYFYSHVSEIYITPDTVPFSRIEDVANKRIGLYDKAMLLLSPSNAVTEEGNIDIGASIMKIKKR